jgi:hypothetical protein
MHEASSVMTGFSDLHIQQILSIIQGKGTILDTIKKLMSYPKCRNVEVINNPVRPESNYIKFNYINYK